MKSKLATQLRDITERLRSTPVNGNEFKRMKLHQQRVKIITYNPEITDNYIFNVTPKKRKKDENATD
jgi:hypothetical protein